MREALSEVQKALLEADVSFPVVKDFMARVTEQAVGEQVLKSLKPGQQVVGIVHQELVNLMGPVDNSLHLRGELPVLMLCGLQGSGKTTTCGKLGRMLKDGNRKPMLVAADLQRPAAIDQLHVIGDQLGIDVFSDKSEKDPVKLCRRAIQEAKKRDVNVVVLDTAGRLHVDDELMDQLTRIDRQVEPEQVYLVVDGMTGQDAVNSAKAFNEALELDGVIMTKLDGDARGGAALSVKHVTGVPIKYIGTGEHLDALEPFRPEGMAERILGMGDMVELVRQVQTQFDQEKQKKLEEDLKKGEFTLDHFRQQLDQFRRPGLMQKMMSLMPGMGDIRKMMGDADNEQDLKRMVGMIDSMTADERRNPTKVIDQSRRRRIAAGSGTEPHEVNELVKQFDGMASVMKQMAGKGMRERMSMMRDVQRTAMSPGGMQKVKKGTGKRLSNKEKAKLRKEREKLKKKKRKK